MKTATVRDLRNHYSSLMGWIDAGEEVVITRRGEPIATLAPIKQKPPENVNWAESPAVTRDRSGERPLTAQESLDIIHDAASKW